MPDFKYEARNFGGKTVTGTVAGATQDAAKLGTMDARVSAMSKSP